MGLFGDHCSSGCAGHNNAGALVREAGPTASDWQMVDTVGIEFLLPIGRWKGDGGEAITRARHGDGDLPFLCAELLPRLA
jgi:hypothetical protein